MRDKKSKPPKAAKDSTKVDPDETRELTADELKKVAGGRGTLQDFTFTQKVNKSTPG